MIEPCWPWMKRKITEKGALRTRKEAEKAWTKCWKNLSQKRIQGCIERMPRYIAEVIRLKGGNEYREGSKGVTYVRMILRLVLMSIFVVILDGSFKVSRKLKIFRNKRPQKPQHHCTSAIRNRT